MAPPDSDAWFDLRRSVDRIVEQDTDRWIARLRLSIVWDEPGNEPLVELWHGNAPGRTVLSTGLQSLLDEVAVDYRLIDGEHDDETLDALRKLRLVLAATIERIDALVD